MLYETRATKWVYIYIFFFRNKLEFKKNLFFNLTQKHSSMQSIETSTLILKQRWKILGVSIIAMGRGLFIKILIKQIFYNLNIF